MELDKLFEAFEKYSQEFIIYLLSFFRQRSTLYGTGVIDAKNKVILFSLMSAIAGSYLINRYGQGVGIAGDDLTGDAIQEILWWTGAGAFMYVIMSRFPPRIGVMEPMLVVFKVFPVAWIASGFTVYVTYSIVHFMPVLGNLEYIVAEWACSAVYLGMVVFYLPRSFRPIETKSILKRGHIRAQRRAGTVATTALVAIIIIGRQAAWTIQNWGYLIEDGNWIVSEGNWIVRYINWTIAHFL